MSIKKILAVCAAMAVVGAFADEAETESEIDYGPKSYGWTCVALGVATPVQLPWGLNKWDVFGLDLNLGYSDAPRMYGWQFALGANTARKDFGGLATAIGFNYSAKDAYGLDLALFNLNSLEFYGLGVDAFSKNNAFYGVSADLLGNFTEKEFVGFEIAGLANVNNGDMYGVQAAIVANLTRRVHGLSVACIYNQTDLLWGCQIGLVNMAFKCDHGFQIGLINVIMDNQVPFLPIVNGYFN